jgi:ArsR family transcriptional regulator
MKHKCCGNIKSNTEICKTADLLAVIAEENRLKILCILKKGKRCVCDIWQDIGITQNLASHHLKVLKDAGLLSSKKKGLSVFYCINEKGLAKFSSSLNKLLLTKK